MKELATTAASSLLWHLVAASNEELLFHVPFNGFSWGEELKVTFYPGKLILHSQCRLVTQCLDWGKNRRNCAKLLKAMAIFP